jgi:hypothetical protein
VRAGAAILQQYGGVDHKTMELYAASLIQKVFRKWRKHKATRDEIALGLKREAAATILQAGYRGTLTRRKVAVIRSERDVQRAQTALEKEQEELARAVQIAQLAQEKKGEIDLAISDRSVGCFF